MAIRRIGRAWGNALGGWRSQPRGPMGRFMKKGGGSSVGSKSNYRPSRNQIAAQQRQQAQIKAQKRVRNQKIAKNVAIVGGVALAAGGAYYGVKAGAMSQKNTFDTRQGAKYARNAAKYTPKASKVPNASRMRAGSFPTHAMSPMAPIGIRGFSNAATVSHHIQKLLPPVSFHTNTRRPARYRKTGAALKNVQAVDMQGKELIPKRDMTRELRSINMRKTNWKKRATNAMEAAKAAKAAKPAKAAPSKKQKTAAVQNPAKAATSAAKATSAAPKPKKAAAAPKSKNVAAPKAAVTVSDVTPAKPAVGTGSKKTKASPAKQAATGGGKKTPKAAAEAMPENFYESNYAPMGDSDDVKISGGKMTGVDPYGETVVIPIAGQRRAKPVGRLPGKGSRPQAPARPRANNQPKPMETVQRQATKSAGNEKNIPDSIKTAMDPTRIMVTSKNAPEHSKAWYAQEFNLQTIKDVAGLELNKTQIKTYAGLMGLSKGTSQKFADAIGDYRKANRRSKTVRNPLDGKKMGKDEKRAASLAGEVVTRTRSDASRIANMNDKMAKGKMAGPSEGEIKSAMDLLKSLGGMHGYTAEMLWEEATGPNKTLWSVEERKAMRLVSNWKNMKKG